MSQFDPTAFPIIIVPDDPHWEDFASRLRDQYRDQVYFLHIELDGGLAKLDGTVASEHFHEELERLVFAEPYVLGVSNNTIVTAPLVPAQSFDIEDWSGNVGMGPAPDTDETIVRYPSIVPIGQPQVGALFEIKVDLTRVPDGSTDPEPFAISDPPDNWQELPISTRLASTHLDLSPDQHTKTVMIRRNQESVACTFVGRVNQKAASSGIVEVMVLFDYRDRFSGSARAALELADAAAGKPPPGSGVAAPPTIDVSRSAASPGLTVYVVSQGGPGESTWIFNCPGATDVPHLDARGTSKIEGSPREHLKELFSSIQVFDPTTHRRRLKGIGERIWSLAPTEFRSLYAILRERLGSNFSIQFVTDDPFMPWEFMFPSEIQGADHLFISHPVARWEMSNAPRASSFAAGDIVTFVPEYTVGSLPASLVERDFIVNDLGGVPMSAKYASFLDFLGNGSDTPVQVLHFAGHGRNAGAGKRGIEMEDGTVTIEDLTSDVTLGTRCRSVVILNACEVGGQDIGLGVVESWPETLIRLQFGGVIAPLWAVRDEHASDVIKATLKTFRAGEVSLGESLRAARESSRDRSSTAYAYLLHGDVMAKGRTTSR